MKAEWETINDTWRFTTYRLRVPGGWLYRVQPTQGAAEYALVPDADPPPAQPSGTDEATPASVGDPPASVDDDPF